MPLVPLIHCHVPGNFSRFWDIPLYELPCLLQREALVQDAATQEWVAKVNAGNREDPGYTVIAFVERNQAAEYNRLRLHWDGLGSDNKTEAWRLAYPTPLDFSKAFNGAVDEAVRLQSPPDMETKAALKEAAKAAAKAKDNPKG